MMRKFLYVAFVVALLSLTVLAVQAQTSSPSVWGYLYVNGVKVTSSNASNITGRYPVPMYFDRLPSYSGDPAGFRDQAISQYLTGYNNLHYSVLSYGGSGNYNILVYVKGQYRTCARNIYISGNKQVNCYITVQ